jgi:hypothetical protein
VYGSGDGATFAVATTPVVANPGGGQSFYLLRLRSGRPAPLLRLSVGRAVGPGPTAVALSPDGTKIAMAFTYRTSPPTPQPLVLYSTVTGAVLRTWTVTSGIISGTDPMGNGDPSQDVGASLRWTASGQGLAFAFHANAAPGKQGYGYDRDASIRVLDTTSRGGDLIARSRLLRGAGPEYIPSGVAIQCLVSSGWSPSADGRAITCAAKWGTPGAQPPAGARPTKCTQAIAGPTTRQQWNLGFWRDFWLPGGGGGGGAIYSACLVTVSSNVQLLWASSDGTTVLGRLDRPGHSMFGLFRAGTFRALPPPPAGIPLSAIAW